MHRSNEDYQEKLKKKKKVAEHIIWMKIKGMRSYRKSKLKLRDSKNYE